jgi:putative PIN family toxin of toxin-antitoxin system
MRVVLDTNTVISGLFWRGRPFEVLELMRSGKIKVYTSEAIREELLDVLQRPKFSQKLALLNSSAQEVVNRFISWVEVIEVGEVAKVVASDPDDDQIIACAKLANADFIISGDADILNLKDEISIPVVNAGQFLDILASYNEESN